MKNANPYIPIGIKIFGISSSLLCLLGIIAMTAQYRLRRVNQAVSDLADYITPTTNHISRIEVHGLEQEIHFERLLKLYTFDPIDTTNIEKEQQQFETHSQTVKQELEAATALIRTGIEQTDISDHQRYFQQVANTLTQIEQGHQQFHDAAIDLFQALGETHRKGDRGTELAALLVGRSSDLEQAVDALDHTISESRIDLDAFTQQTVQLSQQYQRSILRDSLLITSGAIVLGLLYAAVVTSGIVRPVFNLTRRVQALQSKTSEAPLAVHSRDEIGILANVFNQMLKELANKETLKEIFGKYVDPRLVERLTTYASPNDLEIQTQGEKKVVSVLMSDLVGIDLTEQINEPTHLVEAINQYLNLLSPTISEHQGLIEFVETTIKGFWTSPFVEESQHAQLACKAALQQLSYLQQTRATLSQFLDSTFDIQCVDLHIGLATGPLVLANIGPQWAKTYTVLGDIVNTSARLKGAAKYLGVPILMMSSTQQQVKNTMATRALGTIQVVGKDDKLLVYELLGLKNEVSDSLIELKTSFEQGLAAYRQQQWSHAQAYFNACLTLQPQDGPAQRYLENIQVLRSQVLPADWDGVLKLDKK